MKHVLTLLPALILLSGCGVEIWESKLHRYRYVDIIDGPVSNDNLRNSFAKLEKSHRPYLRYPHWSFMDGTKLIEPEFQIYTASAFGDEDCLEKTDTLIERSEEDGWSVIYSVCYQTRYLGW